MAGFLVTAVVAVTASTGGARIEEGVPGAQLSSSSPAGGLSSRSVWSGVYSEAQARRGEDLYLAHCVACHGDFLEGHGPATPLTGQGFSANWDGQSLGEMLDRTRLTMPINKPNSLSRQQVADILAFVLEANRFPIGKHDLPRQAEILNQITFLATKP